MLTERQIKEFTKKFQTTERNVVREYVQHAFLASLYKLESAVKLLFKGGTALRIIYQSPRFSEDLDFTGHDIFHCSEIEDLFLAALTELDQAGIPISFKEAKPTTGGYLGLIHYEIFDVPEDMKFEVSLRKGRRTTGEVVSVAGDFTPPYTLIHLPPKEMVGGKMEALLARGKPRDYYDLYFMLRHQGLNKHINKKLMREALTCLEAEKIDFKRELSVLLPISHHLVLKNFKSLLKKEMMKYL